MSKKICVLSHWSYKTLHGGNIRSYFLLKEIINKKDKLTLFVTNNDDKKFCQKKFKCEVVNLNLKMSRWDNKFIKIYKYIAYAIKLIIKMRSIKVDYVFGINLIHALPISLLNKKIKKSIIYVDLWADFFWYNSFEKKIFLPIAQIIRFFEFYTIKKSDKCIVITKYMKKLISIKKKSHIKVIPDGADTLKFNKKFKNVSKLKKKYNIPPYNHIVSYQGGVSRHEGLDLLCYAAEYVLKVSKNVTFLIVGRGEFLDFCKEIVHRKKLEKNFIFTGWLDQRHLPELISSVDVSVVPMPKVRASKPIISFKLLEAMASGVKIVASDTPGIKEIVTDKEVFLTNVSNKRLFAETILRACKSDGKEKIKYSEKKIRNLDWRSIAKKDYSYLFN